MLLAALVPLIAGCAIDFAKFNLLFGFPASAQVFFTSSIAKVNDGKYFSLRFLPSTFQAYISPTNLRVTPVFPYLSLSNVPTHAIAHTQLFTGDPTASAPPSMPLLFATGLSGPNHHVCSEPANSTSTFATDPAHRHRG